MDATTSSASATSQSDNSMVTKDADMDNSLDMFDITTSRDEVVTVDHGNEIIPYGGRGGRFFDASKSDNLWERTDVLAGK